MVLFKIGSQHTREVLNDGLNEFSLIRGFEDKLRRLAVSYIDVVFLRLFKLGFMGS